MRPKNIELYIEELVLEGFEPADRYSIGEAVEQELTRLFVEKGVPPGLDKDGDVSRLNGVKIEMVSGSKVSKAGVSIAKSVYGSLRK